MMPHTVETLEIQVEFKSFKLVLNVMTLLLPAAVPKLPAYPELSETLFFFSLPRELRKL